MSDLLSRLARGRSPARLARTPANSAWGPLGGSRRHRDAQDEHARLQDLRQLR